MKNTINLTVIPSDLHWDVSPQNQQATAETLTITAGPKTDLFTDPGGEVTLSNSPRLLFTPNAEFQLSAQVSVEFASTFDAGVLLLYADASHWAKLCFEFSPQQQPMVVSVVNRKVSDDCNSAVIEGNSVYLRVSRLQDRLFAYHYSTDEQTWHLVRYFKLDGTSPIRAGFSVQSPTGQGCTATFSNIQYQTKKLASLRSGE